LFQILSAAMPQIPQTTACVCAAQPPGRAAGIPSADLLHDFEGAQARVGTKQKRQGQFQAVAQRAQIFSDIARYLPTNANPALEVRWWGSFWIINHVM